MPATRQIAFMRLQAYPRLAPGDMEVASLGPLGIFAPAPVALDAGDADVSEGSAGVVKLVLHHISREPGVRMSRQRRCEYTNCQSTL